MKKEICQLCTEYSIDTVCEMQDDCKINAVIRENERLNTENAKLKNRISKLENEMSYMNHPYQIGDRHEMGS